jgi:PPOX class probable F420-dependent enzyme
VLDETTEFGQRAKRRLREEIIAWLTTISPQGAPQPVPVWFLWDGADSILLYTQPGKPKLRNIDANPRVSLNLDSDTVDADVVVCWGEARVSDDPPADQVPEYVDKYAERIAALGWTPESFAADYSVPLRIELSRIHGW